MKFKLIFLFIFIIIPISSSSSSNFTLFGTTHINQTTITLTQNPNPNCASNPPLNTGRLFSKNPVRFLDSGFNSTLSFSTHFSFTIIPHCLPGEGLAFVITSDSISLPYSVNCIGLPKDLNLNSNSNSLDEFSTSSYGFFAVEFDTSYDQNLGDINDNHVGIDLDSIFSIASVDLMTNGVDLRNGGKVINSWIEYNSSKKVVQVWVGYQGVRPISPILVAPVDLSNKFNGFMYVGFSGSSGKGSDTYLINSWEFKTFGMESGFQNLDVEAVGLDDCLICFPEGLDKENGPEPKTGQGLRSSDHHPDKGVLSLVLKLLVLNLGLILVIGVCVVMFFCLRNTRNPSQNGHEEAPARMHAYHEDTNTIPKRFKISEIRSATKGFNRNLIIGEGVSAIVYKTDMNIAVKRFKTGSYGSQFASEFVTIVGSLRHKNLMKLQGWCCEKTELLLVYDYMPNGSLDKMLHNPANDLSFKSRLNILLGVSSALVYLHEECERPIIHRNVKSCNIMLDLNYIPKLGDFGMAELYEHSSRTHDVTVSARCMGYLAPEYVYSGVPTVKTDVYSFGVVVLEVASGRPAVDKNGVVVTDWVWDLWEEKRLVAAADGNLMGRFNRVEMEKVLSVGLICVHPNYQLRPTMKDVMKMLKGEMVVKLPAMKPTVMIQSVASERSPEVVARSGGDDSITIWGTPASHFSK